jgi:hypothetical protein
MTPLEQDCAEALAFALAEVMWTSMPSLFAEPPESVVALTLPFACALVRAESRAARNKKAAKKYRSLQREVGNMVRTEPDSPVRHGRLGQTVVFDPAAWHTALVPGLGHDAVAVRDGAS